MHRWSIVDAKARLSEVMAEARLNGPQMITRMGRDEVVMLNADAWEPPQPKPTRLFFLNRFDSNPRLSEAEADMLACGRPYRRRADPAETPILTPLVGSVTATDADAAVASGDVEVDGAEDAR